MPEWPCARLLRRDKNGHQWVTHSSGLLATFILAPLNCLRKLTINWAATSGTASKTTKRELLSLANRLENRLYAISEPMRTKPMQLMVFARERDAWLKSRTVDFMSDDEEKHRTNQAPKAVPGRPTIVN